MAITTPVGRNDIYTRSGIVVLNGAHDLTIAGKSIAGGAAPAISLSNCYNIRITRNKLYNSVGVGIHLYNCENITIDHNYFANVSTGVYAEKVNKGGIIVDRNQFLNMQGPFPRGQCIQFNEVNGPGNAIIYNRCENVLGKSNAEDAISLYKCNGTAGSPIIVKGNWIRGGGPSRSGGGIMLGDSGGSYQTASDNILVDPGQYGIAISGGDHNAIINNSIYGRPQPFTNVGLYVAGFNGSVCTNSTVARNKVRYFNSKRNENDAWISPGTPKPAGLETNSWGANIGPSILPHTVIEN
jgi:parallel beta-helix repeat protein